MLIPTQIINYFSLHSLLELEMFLIPTILIRILIVMMLIPMVPAVLQMGL